MKKLTDAGSGPSAIAAEDTPSVTRRLLGVMRGPNTDRSDVAAHPEQKHC
jgi:hypothetical protein